MAIINNSVNNTTGGTQAGTTSQFQIINDSNTASSIALEILRVGGGSAGDPFHSYQVTGGSTYSVGIDNSDSDAYVISAGASPGSTNIMRALPTGEINYPLQPTFAARLATTVSNVTGDGTVYTVIFDTEEFDVAGNFDITTGIFTAPVTGKYLFNVLLSISIDTTTASSEILSLVTTAHTYRIWTSSSTTLDLPTSHNGTRSGSLIVAMTANDTAKVTVVVNGTTKTSDVAGENGAFGTYFSGILIA